MPLGQKPVGQPIEGKTPEKEIKLSAPPAKSVRALVKQLKDMKLDVSAAVGDMGSVVKKAVEKDHFDRKALGIVRGLEALSDKKLAITLPHLLKYIDDLDLGTRAAKQGEMFEAAEEEDSEVEEETTEQQTEGRRSPDLKVVGDVARDVVEHAGESMKRAAGE